MGWFSWLNSEPMNLREWVIAYIYRCDAGLYEIEQDYVKKYKKKAIVKIRTDRGYQQLQGKLTMLLALAQDFNIKFYANTFGTRITRRLHERGGKWAKMK